MVNHNSKSIQKKYKNVNHWLQSNLLFDNIEKPGVTASRKFKKWIFLFQDAFSQCIIAHFLLIMILSSDLFN